MKTLMVQGTTSDAGKSTLVAGLCRVLYRRGVKVAPFKPQNMALNSAVTVDGGEIGRAQAVQAQASGIDPHTDFNPVLLKPNSDTACQVIIHGNVLGNQEASTYHDYKKTAMQAVLSSYQRLSTQYEYLVVEGAGSPAEINLREGDIANMGFAEVVDCPVVLIADIDRGGVFAHIVGTLALLSDSERARVVGFVINRFRGEIALLQSGLDWLENETGKPVLGVLPYLHNFHLEAEDAISRTNIDKAGTVMRLKVIVPVLPHISNHTDFDALRLHPNVDFQFINMGEIIPPADLMILPGSKNVRGDLQYLRDYGWQQALTQHLRYGGKVIGICGGFQMLGEAIHDPHAIEGDAGTSQGFNWLAMQTTLENQKQLKRVRATLCFAQAQATGYEIHMGMSTGEALQNPALTIEGRPEGAISSDNQIAGTYLHGLFDHAESCAAWLTWAGLSALETFDYEAFKEAEINRLADSLEQHLDWGKLSAYLS